MHTRSSAEAACQVRAPADSCLRVYVPLAPTASLAGSRVRSGRRGPSLSGVNVTVRKRPLVHLSLSPEALGRLAEIATRCGETRSGVVERLIREAEMPRPRSAGKVER